MTERIWIEHISIVLNRPRFPENIGSSARAMRNMGIRSLIVVEPEDFDSERIRRMATHESSDVVDGISVFGSLKEALQPFQYVAGTTARLGGQRKDIENPAELAQRLIPISKNNRIAIVFGSEDRGLSNEDIRYCHTLVNIPTADFHSLNLAQAVMIICYEIYNAHRVEPETFVPRLANRHELEGMYDHLRDILLRISFINPQNPDFWLNNLRNFLNRLPLRAKEVKIIRGICRQIDWYGNQCYQDGQDGKNSEPRRSVSSDAECQCRTDPAVNR